MLTVAGSVIVQNMKRRYPIAIGYHELRGEIVEIRKLEMNQMENLKNLYKSVFMNDP